MHNILYVYSHEKMREFTEMPEMARLFMSFAGKGASELAKDEKMTGPLEEIVKLCKETFKQ